MSTTVHAFPPLQSMTSPRGWVLAIIVGLHALFFWAFTAGLGPRIVEFVSSGTIQVIPPQERAQPPARTLQPPEIKDNFIADDIVVPTPDDPLMDPDRVTETAVQRTTTEMPPPQPAGETAKVNTPVIEQPKLDSRLPLSEPDYPAGEIRDGHAGTVLLSVYVLENGRIGDVRVEQSSGFPKLDASAAREAKRWRMKPGTQDGRPMAMWKTIPITFRLNNLSM